MRSKYDPPSLADMRQWLEIFIAKPPEVFFASGDMETLIL
jgi:hypothetical protein